MQRRILFTAAAVLLVLVVGVTATVEWARRAVFEPIDPLALDVEFEVRAGQGLNTVVDNLAAAGLIRNALPVALYGRYRNFAPRLQAGRYRLSAAMSADEMLRRVVGGEAEIEELLVTIPEGWSVDQITAHFERQGLFARAEFAEAVVMQDAYRDFRLLAHLQDDTILDGYLFPDTYRIFPHSTPVSVVRRMLANFERRMDAALLAEIESQGRTLHEVLTLASIVQGESLVYQMPDVAGVFWKRLQRGIRLESDATVNYVLGTSKRQPTFADVRVAHPYNTYQNAGLPPGPIGNPGMDAIRAAVHPAENPFFFFLHKPDGEIVFSRTFAEHLAAKARYLD